MDRTASAARATSASLCRAVKAKRSRAVPGGTVGGLMAADEKALLRQFPRGFERRLRRADNDRDDGALRLGQAKRGGERAGVGERPRDEARLAFNDVERGDARRPPWRGAGAVE